MCNKNLVFFQIGTNVQIYNYSTNLNKSLYKNVTVSNTFVQVSCPPLEKKFRVGNHIPDARQ